MGTDQAGPFDKISNSHNVLTVIHCIKDYILIKRAFLFVPTDKSLEIQMKTILMERFVLKCMLLGKHLQMKLNW